MPKRKRKGFALALTLFLILILSTVCFGALSIATIDSRITIEDYKSSRALYAARAGLAAAQSGVAKARNEVGISDNFSYSNVSLSDDGDERYSVTVTPASDNNDRNFAIWKVISTGYYDDAVRQVEAYLEIESFSRYAYFTDYEGNNIQFISRDSITGDVHTNGYFLINGHPHMYSRTTSSNNGDTRFNSTTYKYTRTDGKTATDPADFYRAASNNYNNDKFLALNDSTDFSFSGGQTAIPLPTDSGITKAAAQAEGHYYTGKYIVVFTEAGKAKLYKGENKTTYVYGRPTTSIVYSGYPSASNGYKDQPTTTLNTSFDDMAAGLTMYFSDEIQVYGTVNGRVTLGCANNINITDDILYKDDAKDVLGMISNKNIIVVSDKNTNKNRYIRAVMMALTGSFTVQDYDKGSSRGTLDVYGGIIQKTRGAVGTSSQVSPTYTQYTGYFKDYKYDRKLRTRPPLNFPTTGRLTLRFFVDKGSIGAS
ncbi:MAG: hypothetical protein K6G50_13735 [bacterium]|nr:hypothetical protein [bacterium]